MLFKEVCYIGLKKKVHAYLQTTAAMELINMLAPELAPEFFPINNYMDNRPVF